MAQNLKELSLEQIALAQEWLEMVFRAQPPPEKYRKLASALAKYVYEHPLRNEKAGIVLSQEDLRHAYSKLLVAQQDEAKNGMKPFCFNGALIQKNPHYIVKTTKPVSGTESGSGVQDVIDTKNTTDWASSLFVNRSVPSTGQQQTQGAESAGSSSGSAREQMRNGVRSTSPGSTWPNPNCEEFTPGVACDGMVYGAPDHLQPEAEQQAWALPAGNVPADQAGPAQPGAFVNDLAALGNSSSSHWPRQPGAHPEAAAADARAPAEDEPRSVPEKLTAPLATFGTLIPGPNAGVVKEASDDFADAKAFMELAAKKMAAGTEKVHQASGPTLQRFSKETEEGRAARTALKDVRDVCMQYILSLSRSEEKDDVKECLKRCGIRQEDLTSKLLNTLKKATTNRSRASSSTPAPTEPAPTSPSSEEAERQSSQEETDSSEGTHETVDQETANPETNQDPEVALPAAVEAPVWDALPHASSAAPSVSWEAILQAVQLLESQGFQVQFPVVDRAVYLNECYTD